MMVRRHGVIINISSILACVLGRGSAAYAATKAGLNRFTEVAAQELGKKGIRVNGVAPGLLDTGMGVGMLPEAEAITLARTPLGRKGTLGEVVEAVLFLASPRASYITGHTLTVDGGVSCG
jgi:3-oxoacyl-[acyl-carrier protein] reductase